MYVNVGDQSDQGVLCHLSKCSMYLLFGGGGAGGGGGEGVPGRRSILQEKVCICLRMSQKTVHVRDGHEHTDEPRSVFCLNTHAGPRNAVCECVCV